MSIERELYNRFRNESEQKQEASNAFTSIKECYREVAKAKRKLQAKLDKGEFYENFGQDEVRDLRDRIPVYSEDLGPAAIRTLHNAVETFNEWCMNATPKHENKEPKVFYSVEVCYPDGNPEDRNSYTRVEQFDSYEKAKEHAEKNRESYSKEYKAIRIISSTYEYDGDTPQEQDDEKVLDIILLETIEESAEDTFSLIHDSLEELANSAGLNISDLYENYDYEELASIVSSNIDVEISATDIENVLHDAYTEIKDSKAIILAKEALTDGDIEKAKKILIDNGFDEDTISAMIEEWENESVESDFAAEVATRRFGEICSSLSRILNHFGEHNLIGEDPLNFVAMIECMQFLKDAMIAKAGNDADKLKAAIEQAQEALDKDRT